VLGQPPASHARHGRYDEGADPVHRSSAAVRFGGCGSRTLAAHKSQPTSLHVQENARPAASLALIKANQYPAYGEVRHLQSVEIADATLCEAREAASPATT
jgi:hypothetical protein